MNTVTAQFNNEGVAKVCCMHLVGRGADFEVVAGEGSWRITVTTRHAEVFRGYQCDIISGVALPAVRVEPPKATPPAVASPFAPKPTANPFVPQPPKNPWSK